MRCGELLRPSIHHLGVPGRWPGNLLDACLKADAHDAEPIPALMGDDSDGAYRPWRRRTAVLRQSPFARMNTSELTKRTSIYAPPLRPGATRLRPVMMTAMAMIIGMIPMALGMGDGGETERFRCLAAP